MAIYIITGRNGHGKTAYMVRMMRELIRSGERIYSNIKINPKEMGFKTDLEGDIDKQEDRENEEKRILYWQNFSDWFHMKDGTIFCDEGLVYFNARNWESLPHQMQIKFVQHRKEKLDLILNVQHYTFIEKTLRVLCERFVDIRMIIGSKRFKKSFIPRISRVSEYELQTLNRCENLGIDPSDVSKELAEKYNIEPIYKGYFWIRKKIFSWYDTSVQVSESRPEPLQHLARLCLECGLTSIRHK